MVGHVGPAIPLEVVGTMIEMADVAWNALEHRRERKIEAAEEDAAARLLFENQRLRALLAHNATILQALSKTPSLSVDCPPDLYKRLEAAVDATNFLTEAGTLHHERAGAKGDDFEGEDVLVNADSGKPSCWVWIPEDMDLATLEEVSGIDNENYVVVGEENVVDGIANFVAMCILQNPKSKVLTPEDLRKAVTRALGGIKDSSKLKKVWEVGKVIYTLSTWGIVFTGLYRHRAVAVPVLKVAAKGIHATGKVVLRAL